MPDSVRSLVRLQTCALVPPLTESPSPIGAKEVISLLEERKSVVKLVLSHNDLRDEGCVALFQYLCSERGRRHPVKEISLTANGIGDRGLSAIADYMVDNVHLRELFLQNVSI